MAQRSPVLRLLSLSILSLTLAVGCSGGGDDDDTSPTDAPTATQPGGETPTQEPGSTATQPDSTPTEGQGDTPTAGPGDTPTEPPVATPTEPQNQTPTQTPQPDADGDGEPDVTDNCPADANSDQSDLDSDGLGDACDICPNDADPNQEDSDSDGLGDACDVCPNDAGAESDGDGICDSDDNCPDDDNLNQMDRDGDGEGDACDACPDDNPNNNDDGSCGDFPAATGEGDFDIYAMIPGDGYEGVATGFVGAEVFFNTTYRGEFEGIMVRVTSEHGDVQTLPAITNFNFPAKADFFMNLEEDTDYCATVWVVPQEEVEGTWPVRETACFTTKKPCGVTINSGFNTKIESLGDTGGASLIALNNALEDYDDDGEADNNFPSVLLMRDIDSSEGFPTTVDISFAAFEMTGESTGVLRDEGYSSHFTDCEITTAPQGNGTLNCTADSMVLHLYRGDYRSNVFINNATISGRVVSSGNISTINNYRLAGVVPRSAVELTFAQLGEEYEQLANLISYDQDTDGDGENDAATFEVSTDPQPFTLDGGACR